jgi:glutamate dehydrogenase
MLAATAIPQKELQQVLTTQDAALYRRIERALGAHLSKTSENLDWLYANMHPYFFITMKEEMDVIVNLAVGLQEIRNQIKLTLTDQEKKLIIARLDLPGSIYDTLKALREREISYAEMIHSYGSLPGTDTDLEIQKFEFDRKTHEEIVGAGAVRIPNSVRKSVFHSMKQLYPDFNFQESDDVLRLLWINNQAYVRISPPERVARILWLYQQARIHDGLYLDVEGTERGPRFVESRLLFSVGNPSQKAFITQVSEVFQRLNIGVRRSYSLYINTGHHPYFLGTFYVTSHDGGLIEKGSSLFRVLQAELYNTQILSTNTYAYNNFLSKGIMTGEETSLSNVFVGFCHTSLAHNQPDRFGLETVKSAFHSDADMILKLVNVFRMKFDPDIESRDAAYKQALEETLQAIESYNTGQKHLDEIRRTIFSTCLAFIRYTLKTNFYVAEKHALAFRLDPAYLNEFATELTSDLPAVTPYRITFFFGRYGVGYHIGFSDIARGGWRTVICRDKDEYATNTNSLFREVFVLAHTQHLKNKDIYEGGSKLVVVLNAENLHDPSEVTQRLYKLQYGFINAFLDIFVTEGGKVKNPRVIDYYGEDEPIELGPDENMHDAMIELIAKQSVKRRYILGTGIMSSKRIGINHKEYGVTSRGVMKYAEIAMKEVGVDVLREPFSVKFTGGPNGDVAGNSMHLLLMRCPHVKILVILDGTAGLYDPEGANHKALSDIVLRHDLDHFNSEALHSGGFMVFREEYRKEGPRKLYKKMTRTDSGVQETWITVDELYRELDHLLFSVSTDLFIPCGGRPETIDSENWHKLFPNENDLTARVIIEGANSFISPKAREEIQKRGVVLIRDASANKCGVISSSYEIIANLLMTDKEFLMHKDKYLKDVLGILENKAEEEANVIFKRYREHDGNLLYTEISSAISTEINEHYAKLFIFFQDRQDLLNQPVFRKAILNHLPAFIRENTKYRAKVNNLSPKIKSAMLASQIGSSIVYHGDWEVDFENRLKDYLKRQNGKVGKGHGQIN